MARNVVALIIFIIIFVSYKVGSAWGFQNGSAHLKTLLLQPQTAGIDTETRPTTRAVRCSAPVIPTPNNVAVKLECL